MFSNDILVQKSQNSLLNRELVWAEALNILDILRKQNKNVKSLQTLNQEKTLNRVTYILFKENL